MTNVKEKIKDSPLTRRARGLTYGSGKPEMNGNPGCPMTKSSGTVALGKRTEGNNEKETRSSQMESPKYRKIFELLNVG